MPSGAAFIPSGRFSLQCQSGLHKWETKVVLNMPYMKCRRCGYYMPKPILEKTETRKKLIENIHKEEEKDKPSGAFNPKLSPDERYKRMEKLVVKLFEDRQKNYKKMKTGKLKYVGGKNSKCMS